MVTGGCDMNRLSLDLEWRPHVIIATPGRLADHVRTNSTFSLDRVKYLVLDCWMRRTGCCMVSRKDPLSTL